MAQTLPDNYFQLLDKLKTEIQKTRLRAAFAANAELLRLYWHIGKTILTQQQQAGWGAKIIDQLAADLRSEFLDMQGLSQRNLLYMRKFAEEFLDSKFVQRPVAQLPWSHHLILMEKVKQPESRMFI